MKGYEAAEKTMALNSGLTCYTTSKRLGVHAIQRRWSYRWNHCTTGQLANVRKRLALVTEREKAGNFSVGDYQKFGLRILGNVGDSSRCRGIGASSWISGTAVLQCFPRNISRFRCGEEVIMLELASAVDGAKRSIPLLLP